jgi:hypothetical protein
MTLHFIIRIVMQALRKLDLLDKLDPELWARWQFANTYPDVLSTKEENSLIIALAPFVEGFIAYRLNITPALTTLKKSHNELSLIPYIQRQFV